MSRIGAKVRTFSNDSTLTDQYERAQTLYFNWLCVLVHIDDYYGKQWYILAKILHDIEFYWTVPNDDNRATDGVRLREVWLSTLKNEAEDLGVGFDVPPDSLNGPCSMFEMMVALASRIESDIMQSDELGNRTHIWFWYMIHNLLSDADLMNCHWWIDSTNDSSIQPLERDTIKEMVRHCLDRDYELDGRGGCLFPITRYETRVNEWNCVDRREAELWYQAQDWISENFHGEII